MTTPVYICTGFLDSGKTTFVKDTLMKQDWIEEGPTLLLLCEEGEEEYTEEYLDENGMFLFQIEEREQLNPDFFRNCERIYHPCQIVIEYNGMWELKEILDEDFPENWEIQGVYSTVNGETLDIYLKNMRNMLMNHLIASELIVVNRCGEGTNRSAFRRAVKIQNPMAQLLFEGTDGNIIPQTEEDLPYDVKADRIEVEDMDFGIWYVDAYERPQRYIDKEITFLSQTFRPKGMPQGLMIPGRQIMACCAEDIRFYGYPCKVEKESYFEQRGWARVTVRFAYESVRHFAPKQPILYLLKIQKAERPENEVVFLG
ncbi:MAG: hypothetical protein HFG41_01420 [Coprococcus sp.]|nr:hypothetical protein [Coprococcus sp.]